MSLPLWASQKLGCLSDLAAESTAKALTHLWAHLASGGAYKGDQPHFLHISTLDPAKQDLLVDAGFTKHLTAATATACNIITPQLLSLGPQDTQQNHPLLAVLVDLINMCEVSEEWRTVWRARPWSSDGQSQLQKLHQDGLCAGGCEAPAVHSLDCGCDRPP